MQYKQKEMTQKETKQRANIIEVIENKRRLMGITQQALANALGISRSRYSHNVSNVDIAQDNFTQVELVQVMQVLGLDFEDFVDV